MPRKVIWAARAKSDIRAIAQPVAIDLLEKIWHFLSTGQGDVQCLTDVHPKQWRLGLGDSRIRFRDHGDYMEILRVNHRKDAYRH